MLKEKQNFEDADGKLIKLKDLITINEAEISKDIYEIRVWCSNCHYGISDIVLRILIPCGIMADEFLIKEDLKLECPQCKCIEVLRKI